MVSTSSRVMRILKIPAALLILLGGAAALYHFGFAEKTRSRPRTATVKQSPEPQQAHPPAEAGEPQPIEFPRDQWASANLQVEVAQSAPLAEAIELTGKISLNEDKLAHIFPLVEGRVDDVKVRFGQDVKKGELLVIVQSKEVGQGMLALYQDRLKLEFAESQNRWTQEVSDNTQALIKMMQRGAKIDDIEAEFKYRTVGGSREKLMSAYVDFLKSQAYVQRLSPLSPSGAVPGRQILDAESDLKAARAGLLSLQEQTAQDVVQASRMSSQTVKELKTSIAVAETSLKILGIEAADLVNIDPTRQGEKLADYPVFAPFDGTVISKNVVLMERVGPEQQMFTIADLSTVWVTADIYEVHLPLLNQLRDQTIQLRCAAWPDQQFEARIFYTGDVVQETTRTVALRAVADNASGLLKPGMFVTVKLPNLQTASVLQVPVESVLDHDGASFVFVQTGDDEFTRHDVTLGRRNRDSVEIRSGLKPGERVVVRGGFALKSKMLADLLAE